MVPSNASHSVSPWFYAFMKRKLGWKSLDAQLPWVHTKSALCTVAVADKQGLAHSPQGWHHRLCCSVRVSKSFGHGTLRFWAALGQCHRAYRSYTSAPIKGRYAGMERELRMHSSPWGICAVHSHLLWLQHTQAVWASCMALLDRSIKYIMRSSRDTQINPEWNSVRS